MMSIVLYDQMKYPNLCVYPISIYCPNSHRDRKHPQWRPSLKSS